MAKMLLVANGPKFIALKACKALKKYFDDVKIIGYAFDTQYQYEEFDKEEYAQNSFDVKINQEAFEYVEQCDFLFGTEHSGGCQIAIMCESLSQKKITGVQVLDLPLHTFSVLKDYSPNIRRQWTEDYLPLLNSVSVILHNQQKSFDKLGTALFKPMHKMIRYPVCTQHIENYDRKDYILYSGRINPDKGAHYIVEALSVLPISIPLKIITASPNFEKEVLINYAKYLNVDLEILGDCSESNKWRMMHECRFTVCGADNDCIAGLSPLEGISVGRLAVVFDTPENRWHYDRFAMYCQMRNIDSLANCIKSMYDNPKLGDDHARDGIEWCKENCSFEKWALDVYHAYLEAKGK